jgi:hypothetical protein
LLLQLLLFLLLQLLLFLLLQLLLFLQLLSLLFLQLSLLTQPKSLGAPSSARLTGIPSERSCLLGWLSA